MSPAPQAIVGIGDDAAVLRWPDSRVVATTDLLVEGRHFRRSWSTGEDVGIKAAARNLADVAAMGAVPVALLVGLAAPPDVPAAWAHDLATGLAAEAGRAGAHVIGGDVSGSTEIVVAVTALGAVLGPAPVTRAGARPGDVVAVAGDLGHAAAGLALLDADLAEPAELVAAQRRPQPPYDAGPEAAALGATAMIDISDGLLADLGHVAAASGVRVALESARLRPGPLLEAAAEALSGGRDGAGSAPSSGDRVGYTLHPEPPATPRPEPVLPPVPRPLAWMLTGGEGHSLAATFPRNIALPSRWTVIGQVGQGHGVTVDGMNYAGETGWQHFR